MLFVHSSGWSQCGFTIATTVTDVKCHNETSGSIVVNVNGGVAPYQYQLAEAGAGAWQSNNTFNALVANIYPVSVKDATGCIKTVYVTISQPQPLTVTYSATDATCTGSNNGSITSAVTGGTAPYSYNWKKDGVNFATTQHIINLSPANYLLTVTDSKGCAAMPVIDPEVVPVTLSGFNHDVVANGTAAANSSASSPVDDGGWAYYVSGYKRGTVTGPGGLPSSGSFNSAQNSSRSYQLASYSSNNALVLSSPVKYSSATSGTLTFAINHRSSYSTLYVVATTGSGTGTVSYKVNFSDGSNATGSLTFPDWYLAPSTASTQRALGNLDRVSWANPGAFASSNYFNLFEAPINISVANQGKTVNSVTFTWSGSGSARINIMAITGNTSTNNGIRINDGPSSNVTPSVSVASSAPSNQFCSGQQVTFTASPVNGGTSPTYKWYRNGNLISGATASTYATSSLNNNDKIHVVMTSSLSCVTSSTGTSSQLTMKTGTVAASVSASPSATNICSGASVTFTAAPVNGGASPSYQWYRNNAIISGATSPTYTTTSLNNGDAIKVVMTSGISCATGNPATSNTITMNVTPTGEPTVSISWVPTLTFTSTSTFGGSAPLYEWYKNGVSIPGATASTYTAPEADPTDVFSLKMTSDYSCKTAPAAKSNYIQVSQAILPVKMESFTLKTESSQVLMKWRTSQESMNKQFIIQRQDPGASEFVNVGKVPASSGSGGGTYEYTDEPGAIGVFQYRLAQEDIDGRIHYFNILSATIKTTGTWKVIDRTSYWKLQSDRPVQYELLDSQGRLIKKGDSKGIELISKPPSGAVYLLRVKIDKDVSIRKIIGR